MADATFAIRANQLGATAPQQAETQHIISRIHQAHDVLSVIEGHVAAGAEVLWGAGPHPADKVVGPKPVVSGFLGQALDSLESLNQRLGALEQRVARLRSL